MKNQPAFPTHHANKATGEQAGMTLRDYFAAKALTFIAATAAQIKETSRILKLTETKTIALAAYEIADAMLLARDK